MMGASRVFCGFLMVFILIVGVIKPAWSEGVDALEVRLVALRTEQNRVNHEVYALEQQIHKIRVGEGKEPWPELMLSESGEKKTKAALTYYMDTREYNTLNLLTSTTALPYGFKIWGFIDVQSDQGKVHDRFGLTRYFMEYRLQRALEPEWVGGIEGLSLEAEYNDSNGSRNELARFGITYQHGFPFIPKYNGWVRWRALPYETDGDGWQASWIYYLPITDRIWVNGFADINFDEDSRNQWVVEPQINFKLNDRFTLVAEYRFNGFERDNSLLEGSGWAFGTEMKF
ncbi:MAG: hypothetical protein ACI9CF_001942 [Candidatus Omnitrophota bacterium]|jgi:hypothetical protein